MFYLAQLGNKKEMPPLITAHGRQAQADLYEFEASLLNRVNYRTARDTEKNKTKTKILLIWTNAYLGDTIQKQPYKDETQNLQ